MELVKNVMNTDRLAMQ